MFIRVCVVALAGLFATAAFAADINGEWARTDGKAKVRFAPCGGGAVCGVISWLSDPNSSPAKIGERVFYDMKPTGEGTWAGTAFRPEDGHEYAGKLSLKGDMLTTTGCKLGGFMCKSVDWTRAK